VRSRPADLARLEDAPVARRDVSIMAAAGEQETNDNCDGGEYSESESRYSSSSCDDGARALEHVEQLRCEVKSVIEVFLPSITDAVLSLSNRIKEMADEFRGLDERASLLEDARLHDAETAGGNNDLSSRVGSLELELSDLYSQLKTAEFVRCVNASFSTDQVGSCKAGKSNARKQAQKHMKMAMNSPSSCSMREYTDPHCEDAGIVMPGTFSAQAVVPGLFAAPDE
jgi:hypothetical protein